MSIKKIIVFCLLLGTLQACKDSDKSNEVFCTLNFASVNVQVQNAAGHAFVLDSISVFKGKEDITLIKDFKSPQFAEMQKSGSYPIVTDNMKASLLNKNVDVEFKGYVAGKEVGGKIIKVSADECHVFNVTEDLKVIIKEPK